MPSSLYVLILTAFFSPFCDFARAEEAPAKAPTLTPTLSQFRRMISKNHHFNADLPFDKLRKYVGKTVHLPLEYMRSGQVSFAFLTVVDKISRAPEEFHVEWSSKNKEWKFKYNGGKSLLPKTKSLMGVLGPDGIYLLDGNHKSLTSLYFGAKTAPIYLKEDLSVKADGTPYTQEEFREVMKTRGYVFLNNIDGSTAEWTPHLNHMHNDPNRHFVSLITTKLQIHFREDDSVKIKNRRGSEEPLLVKIGRDAEFFELEFSKRLHARGLHYMDKWGNNPPKEFIKEAAEVLWEMRIAGDAFLQKILIFREPRKYSESDLEAILTQFYKLNPQLCEALLNSEDTYF